MPEMKSKIFLLYDYQGKGLLGCFIFLLLLTAAIIVALKLGPIYYANFNFESDIKTETSRAGARFLDNETITKDILALAKKNEIRIKKEDIKIDRYAGQIHIEVTYSVPVDLIFFERDLNFKIKASSFVGSL